jgi:endonuclease G, mitochondrial
MNSLPRKNLSILKIIRSVIIINIAFFLSINTAFAGPIEDCNEYSRLGVPSKQGKLLCRKGFLLAHSSKYKTPLWVIEFLTAEKAKGNLIRYNKVQSDPNLKEGERAELDDYKKSGYNKGQMALAANMKWDQQAMAESFYLSNMIPLEGEGMNQGIWKNIEERVRDFAINRGALYIFTGPIYEDGVMKTIGTNKVAVPTHIFKIIYDPFRVESMAFIMPNEELSTANMHKYFVTIRDIEKKTGLNFLSNLDENVQDIVENKKAQELW